MPKNIHIAMDFDKTLAYHESEWMDTKVGEPIQPMIQFLKACLARGYPVTIFTARVSPTYHSDAQIKKSMLEIREFLKKAGIEEDLPITCEKLPIFSHIFDDRAYHVIPNTGVIVPTVTTL